MLRHSRTIWSVRMVCLTVVFACAVAYALSCTLEVGLVPTGSMENTVLVGDHVLLAKLAYAPRLPLLNVRLPRWKHAKRGDLVSFEHPRSGMTYLKRVVAVGGDTVEIREHKLIVNGGQVTECYVSNSRLWRTMPMQR